MDGNAKTLAMTSAKEVSVAMIGAGAFGATFLSQSRRVRGMSVRVVCDRDPTRARATLAASGFTTADYGFADSRAAALKLIEAGKIALMEDVRLIADLPLDIVVEATGHPAGAAEIAELSLASGYHLALVTKEAEVVIGPLLAHRARAAGLVHTPVDGDQPSLLMALIARAEAMGLPVIAAGKSTESDYVFDPISETVTSWGKTVARPGYGRIFAPGDPRAFLQERIVDDLAVATVPDLCEMGVVANHSQLSPDRPELHAPVARTLEVPRLLIPEEDGGLLTRRGVVDIFACLRRPDELSFAGGVFVVVELPDRATGELLGGKGIPVSADGRYLMMHNPDHLLGVEAPISVMAAARAGRSSGGSSVSMRYDLAARAAKTIRAGEALDIGARHDIPQLSPLLLPAERLSDAAPVPYYIAAGSRAARDIPAGTLLTSADLVLDESNALVRLRREQDKLLGVAP